MELKLEKDEVKNIILEHIEKIMPGKFNNVHFGSYGNTVELTFVDPEKPKEAKDRA